MAEALVISGEDDLWSLLEALLLPQARKPEGSAVHVVGWQPQLLYFPDEPIGHSVTPSMARAVTGFHNSLSRAYAFLAYGQANARLLRSEDQEVLDLRMLVVAGSDGIEVVGEDLGRLVGGIVSKMTGRQITVGVVLYTLLHFSTVIAGEWIHDAYESKRRDREATERVALSEQETKRLNLVTEALQRNPGLKPVADIAADSKEALVRSAVNIDRARILGTPITGAEAKVIVSKPREKGYGRRLDGTFKVNDINVDNPDGYMGILEDVNTGTVFTVAINRGELTDEDVSALFKALEDKGTIQGFVNVWYVGEKLSHASIVRANRTGS